jgi:ABC-type phosphate/phosphonate transport system substrate-binding protein
MLLFSKKISRIFLIVIIALVFLSGCLKSNDEEQTINLISQEETIKQQKDDIQFGIYNELSPLRNHLLFTDMAKDIEEKTLLSTELKLRNSYSEFNKLIDEQKLDVVYMYLDQTAPEDYNDDYSIYFYPTFESPPKTLLIVNDNKIEDIDQLKGQSFGYTEPNSVNSFMVDAYLTEMNENKQTFFKNYFYSFFVDESIAALQSNIVRGISIDSLNFAILQRLDPQNDLLESFKLRSIKEFESGPKPIILFRNDLESSFKEKLIQYFKEFPNDPNQQEIAETLQIKSFKEEINNDRLR